MNLLNKFSIIVLLSTASYSVDVDKHLELSYVQTSGNTNTTTFSSKLEGTAGLSDTQSVRAKGSMLYNENENNTSANKYNLELDYNHMINKKLYANMGINYLKDELSDYDYRLNIGPGLGYKLIEDEIQTVDIQGGLDYAYDKYKTGTTDNYLAGRTELNYKYKFSENLDFNTPIQNIQLDDRTKSEVWIYTRKRNVLKAQGCRCFLIVGKTENKIKNYYLWASFIIEDFVSEYENYIDVKGTGNDFKKPILLNNLVGFQEFKKYCGNFGLGFLNISKSDFVVLISSNTELNRIIDANFLGEVPTTFRKRFSNGLWLMNSLSFNSLMRIFPLFS